MILLSNKKTSKPGFAFNYLARALTHYKTKREKITPLGEIVSLKGLLKKIISTDVLKLTNK